MRKTDLSADDKKVRDFLESAPDRGERRKLHEEVDKVAARYQLSPAVCTDFLAELSDIPRPFYTAQVRQLTCQGRMPDILWDDDTTAMMHRARPLKRSDLASGGLTRAINTRWKDLTRKERDAAHKRRKRFASALLGAFQPGCPARFPKEVVFHYVEIIEKYTGEPFGISHGKSMGGRVKGPRFELLMAALNHACLLRPLSRSTVEHVLRRRPKPHLKKNLKQNPNPQTA
jgi:hypothetical protein